MIEFVICWKIWKNEMIFEIQIFFRLVIKIFGFKPVMKESVSEYNSTYSFYFFIIL